jgi:uroporphyrinogen decarboxylase
MSATMEVAPSTAGTGIPPMTGEERILAAIARRPIDVTPVWFMRQAGGSLPRYLELRERFSVEQIARTPELCAEASLMPLEAFGVDAAVMFADIMLPVAAMGARLELTAAGPILERPIRSADDLRSTLRPLDPEVDLAPMLEAIRIVRSAAGGRAAVIGICGGPFTVAGYLVEGRPSRDQLATKTLMYGSPELWTALCGRISDGLCAYVEAQARAGAQVIQLFDTWAGVLSPADYVRYAAPHARRVLDTIRESGLPSIHYVRASAGILELVADAGGDVIGIDATQSIADAWPRIGRDRAIQGNLDPTVFAAGWPAVARAASAVLADAEGQPGHIFNVGSAAPRDTDPGLLGDLVSFVHDATGGVHQ